MTFFTLSFDSLTLTLTSIFDALSMTETQRTTPLLPPRPEMPTSGLLALATAGFITIMTEALPAGILPALSTDLGVTASEAGQTVTIYAVGSALAAVPLTTATITWPRKRLLLLAIGGFAVANTVTAVSTNYAVTMAARFAAGVVAGLLWALLAGLARRMVPPEQRGKAMAIAMAGIPAALSIGVPSGVFLSGAVGWRCTFWIMTALTLALLAWAFAAVPDFPGQAKAARQPIHRVLAIPGVVPVLVVTLTFVLAHNALYTYIAPFLAPAGLAGRVDLVLLVFGVASLLSIWATGLLIDQRLRMLTIASCALFAVAALTLGVLASVPALVFLSAAVWGLGFGGAATLLQTASAEAAGAAGDIAQSLIVTCWNIGIAGGGICGGLVLDHAGASALPWSALALLVPALGIVIAARQHGFPHLARRAAREASAG